MLVPNLLSLTSQRIWCSRAHLPFQILTCLIEGDKRSSHANLERRLGGSKSHQGHCASLDLFYFDILPTFAEKENVVSCEVFWNPTCIRDRGKTQGPCFHILIDRGNMVAGYLNQESPPLWPRKNHGHEGTTFGRDQFHLDAVTQKTKANGMRGQHRILWAKGTRSTRGIGIDRPAKWKQNRVAVVAQPGAQVVGRTESLNAPFAWLKHPGSVRSRLQRPMSHSKGAGGNRKRIAARKLTR